MKKKKGRGILVLLIIVIILVVNIKSIGRFLYPMEYSNYIFNYSKKYNLSPYMVAAVIKAESDFDKDAVSNKDARGLMQITPSTARWAAEQMKIKNFHEEMLYDEELNIRMGCWYLSNLISEFGIDMKIVLAAYNGGRGNVRKWLNNYENSSDGKTLSYIPFKETDEYVKKVNVNYNMYRLLYSEDENKNYIKVIKEIILRYFS